MFVLPFSSRGSHLRMYKHKIPNEEGTSTTGSTGKEELPVILSDGYTQLRR